MLNIKGLKMNKNTINRLIKKSKFLSYLKLIYFKRKWKRLNAHNYTEAIVPFNSDHVKVGRGTYGNLDIRHFGNDYERLVIGNYCSIGPNCVFILGGEHEISNLSSYPFKTFMGFGNESKVKGDVIIDDDVWLGYGVKILSGVHIGQGAVVAAGAVVVNDVEPYTIVGGVPAKEIKKRFDQQVVGHLLTFDYGALTDDIIRNHINEMYRKIEEMPLDKIKELFEWFPKNNHVLDLKN